jgi:hypothetical protein
MRRHGTMRAYIFSNQGWSSFICSLVTVQGLLRAGLFRACLRLHCSVVITSTNAFLLPSSPPLCSDIALLGHCSARPLLCSTPSALHPLCAQCYPARGGVPDALPRLRARDLRGDGQGRRDRLCACVQHAFAEDRHARDPVDSLWVLDAWGLCVISLFLSVFQLVLVLVLVLWLW